MAHKDTYRDYTHLSEHETEGRHYQIDTIVREDSRVAVIAPHGGKIEHTTSELSRVVAGETFNLYSFEGSKPSGNMALHVTSPRFDEPRCLALVAVCDRVVAMHGLKGDGEDVQVGGLDDQLRDQINARLQEAGFDSSVVTQGPYAGRTAENICNRGRQGVGVQIEIRGGLRSILKTTPERFEAFAKAVRLAIDETMSSD